MTDLYKNLNCYEILGFAVSEKSAADPLEVSILIISNEPSLRAAPPIPGVY
jgi:hypothetical protein